MTSKLTKIIFVLVGIIGILSPTITFAVYGLTKSIDFEKTSSQYASITDAAQTGLDISGNFTFEFWWNPESLVSGDEHQLINKYGDANNRPYRFFFINSGGTQTFTLDTDSAAGSSPEVSSSWLAGTDFTALSTETWYHIAVSKSGTSATLYIDGVSKGAKSATNTIFNGNAALTIGGRPTGASQSDGNMSLMRIWTTARSSTDISNNMCNVLGSTANLSAEWKFDGDTTDNSGNGNTLTQNNTPTFPSETPAVCASASTSSFGEVIFFD